MKIKKIQIYRMPGFPTGLKGLEKLAGNINVIAGPNGSGKSSTARVIQKLLWWNNKTTGYQIDAQIDANGEQNEVAIDSQNYSRTDSRKRTQEDFSFISSAEFSNQYMLALHDLVKDNDNNLAAIIAREVNGGVDIASVKEKLGYRDNTPKLGHTCYKEYMTASETYQRYLREQSDIKRDEENLVTLDEERILAEEARKYIDWYEKVSNYLRTKDRYTLTAEKITRFPVALEKMKEDDFRTIENQEQKISKINVLLDESANIIQSNNEIISGLRIPHSAEMPDELLYELSEKAGQLKDISSDLHASEREIAKLRVIYDTMLKSINSEYDTTGLADLKLPDINKLSEFTRAANETLGIHTHLMNKKMRLEKELVDLNETIGLKAFSVDSIREGITILSNWLKGKKETSAPKHKTLWLVPLLGALCGLAGYLGGLPGLLAGVILSICIIPVINILNKNKAQDKQEDDLHIRIADYQRTKLPVPTAWESESITEKIQELLNELDRINKKRALEDNQKELDDEIERIQEKENEINVEYSLIRKNINIPDAIEPIINNYNSFYVYLWSILKLQDAATELEKYEKEREVLSSCHIRLLNEINVLLRQMNFQEAQNPEQVSAIIHSISREKETRKDALNEIESRNKIITIKEKEKSECLELLEEIYGRLEISSGQKNEVFLLEKEYRNYKETREQLNDDMAHLNANYKLLQDHILFESLQGYLSGFAIEEVQAKIEEYRQLSGKQEGIMQRISDIKAQIKEKTTQNDIEISLSRKEEALLQLGGLLNSNLKALTGSMIISQLHDEISLNNENPVFKQANKILGSITKGRYSLILSEGLQPVFKAYDNIQNQTQPLTEISTGTRVQLLLAIRLAYIESQENNIRLPLLADELLANSDDERSEAIIRSLIEISKNRQLFYFTAQADEVEKWSIYLKVNPELDSKIIFLPGKISNYNKRPSGLQPLKLIHEVCSPVGLTHAEYGEQINVTSFDILEQEITEMHLWYLIENTDILYSCLKSGFYQWGQLNSFLENAGSITGLDTDLWEEMKTKIRLFERFKLLYSTGRSRKINMDILIESRVVTEVYQEKILELLISEKYEPARLLNALDRGAVKGFGANKKEKLRNFLLEKGYLSNLPEYNDNELYVRLSAIISNLDINSSDAEKFLNRFFVFDKKDYESDDAL